MGETTAIAWTDHTFNPWWGCTRVSPGCEHCYAETFAKRTGNDVWGKNADRRFFGDKHWSEPVKWNAKAKAEGRRRRVFCASMADVFEHYRPGYKDILTEHRERLFGLIEDTPWLDWQLLTKRPENVLRMVPQSWAEDYAEYGPPDTFGPWPRNCWIGCTVEDQERADKRIPSLLNIPAPVRFLSCEPLIGPVDFNACDAWNPQDNAFYLEGIQWVIVGGESGPKHRPLNLEHARLLRDQCAAADVAFFFKQIGGRTPTAGGDQLDGETYKAFPCSKAAA